MPRNNSVRLLGAGACGEDWRLHCLYAHQFHFGRWAQTTRSHNQLHPSLGARSAVSRANPSPHMLVAWARRCRLQAREHHRPVTRVTCHGPKTHQPPPARSHASKRPPPRHACAAFWPAGLAKLSETIMCTVLSRNRHCVQGNCATWQRSVQLSASNGPPAFEDSHTLDFWT